MGGVTGRIAAYACGEDSHGVPNGIVESVELVVGGEEYKLGRGNESRMLEHESGRRRSARSSGACSIITLTARAISVASPVVNVDSKIATSTCFRCGETSPFRNASKSA